MALSPEDLRDSGIAALDKVKNDNVERWRYYKGEHELPYAPQGVNDEYEALREMARVPLIRLAIRTATQRLRIDGIRTGTSEDRDKRTWDVWQANKLDARQRIVYVHGSVFGKGIVSVWPNEADPEHPHVKVEDPRNVWVEPDPADPFTPLWAVKRITERRTDNYGRVYTATIVFVYDDEGLVWRFESAAPSSMGSIGDWVLADAFENPLGRIPFVIFAPEMDADGSTASMVDPLVPMQKAIDTIRFDLLLAAQFAAFRQRVVSGYDPVLRDADGNVIVKRDAEGNPLLDGNGMEIPMTATPGRVGVDRLLVFPGIDTKVFDLQESNLENYVKALDMLVSTFSATAQVPAQYLVGDFKNVSGDLMVATEATLLSLVRDLQTAYGESWEAVFSLANVARGVTEGLPLATEVVWADESPKSLAVVASAMAQMVPNGAPARMFLEMLPGATQQKVERWMGMQQDALQRVLGGDLASVMAGPKAPPPTPGAPDADADTFGPDAAG